MTNSSKYEGHSPAPWQFGDFHAILDANGKVIETCPQSAVDFGEGTPEALANGYLLRDAPTLLADNKRLRELLQAILRAPSDGSDGPGSIRLIVQTFILKDIRAALTEEPTKSA